MYNFFIALTFRKRKECNIMKKRYKILITCVTAIALIITLGITNVVPHFAVIPDMVKVGIDYISLDRYKDAIKEDELSDKLADVSKNVSHPFILADTQAFASVKSGSTSDGLTDYSAALNKYVLQNADGLLNTEIYPVMPYVLDEEDSILPISREVINRMIILGYAWQITGDKKYADRAWAELENVCGYDDWCTSHFLATAEMALAVSIGYDWFFDYLNVEQKSLLAKTTAEYAIIPAIESNHWFT